MYLGYPTKKALCQAKGASYHRMCKATVKLKMSTEDALNYALRSDCNTVTHNGVTGMKNIAASLGLTFNQLRYPVTDLGLSIEDAIIYINSDNRNQKDALCNAFKKTRKPVELSPLWALALGIKL